MQGIQSLSLFIDATDDELQWLSDNSSEVNLETGEILFRAGVYSTQFYVVVDGELQITRTVDGEEIVLGTTPRGVMTGEYPMLTGEPHVSTAQAIMPSRLMKFELPEFLGIFTNCPSVGIKILAAAAERLQILNKLDTQREKMAALGKLSAGLAHELNNPAAAARRSSRTLSEMLPTYQARTLELGSLGIPAENLDHLIAYLEDVRTRRSERPALSVLDKADREDEVCDWLDEQGVDDFWTVGASLVDWHVTVDELQALRNSVPAQHVETLFQWLADSLTAVDLLEEIEECTVRIADLIGAVKSYTYMDRGVYQEVDIHHDLDNTLRMLKHRLNGVTVERRYDEALPRLIGRGGALNQVWTNLIDNAVDATDGRGTIKLITRYENNFIMIEIADDGHGIAPEVQQQLFEPFFTTKDVGSGSGLGLDISYRIVRDHKGTIEVRSEPGNTRFIVRLPLLSEDDLAQAEPDIGEDPITDMAPGASGKLL